ncbi:hypothetical protein LX36DRAFT_649963 [Colletotrichum falcatum]|nr:hypothetical protein LX36DRAFT_649963 [Colletotrichum falcatum]
MLITSGMRESHEGVVELDDLEPAVFTSFIRYSLSGNYEVPVTRPVPENHPSLCECIGSLERLVIANLRLLPYIEYMELFANQGHTGKLYGKPPAHPTGGSRNPESHCDLSAVTSQFGPACVHHVKIYIFADKYDVSQLRQLCLHKLHLSLVHERFGDGGYRYLFEAIALAFENTRPGDRLRKLFVQACVADLATVRAAPGYKDLCSRAPELAYEMMMELPEYWNTSSNARRDIASKFPDE